MLNSTGLLGHAMVVIRVGPVYWLIDPQAGEVCGPIVVPTDGSSWPDPDLIVTDQRVGPPGSRGDGRIPGGVSHGWPKFYAPGSRPFYEPRPWHTSPSPPVPTTVQGFRELIGNRTFQTEPADALWRVRMRLRMRSDGTPGRAEGSVTNRRPTWLRMKRMP